MGCICNGFKLRCTRKIEPKENNDTVPTALTQDEISVLQNNWQVLKIHVSNVGMNTFISLFESKPQIQEVFSDFRGKNVKDLKLSGLLRKHSLRVMATLDDCIIHLDNPAFIIPTLTNLGMIHAKLKVPITYLELILPYFLNAIKPYIENHWCPALERAWSKVFTWIIFYIRQGMAQYEKT